MFDTCTILSIITIAVCTVKFFLYATDDEKSFAFRCISGFMAGASAALVIIYVSSIISACI